MALILAPSVDTAPGPALTTVVAQEPPRKVGAPSDPRAATGITAVPRIAAWAISAAAASLALAVGGGSVLALLCLALACAVATALASPLDRDGGSRLSMTVVSAIPAGLLLVFGWALSVGLVGGSLDLRVWASQGPAIVALGLLLALTGAVAIKRRGRIVVVGRDWPALTGTLMLGGLFAFVLATQPMAWWSRMMSGGTDFFRHVGMVGDGRTVGLIDPGAASYPPAFSATAAWITSALGTGTDTASLWRGAQSLAMLMLVVILLAVMAMATRAADVMIEGRWPGIVASVVAGLSFVQTAWFSTFLALGSVMNMIVAVALLAVLLTGITTEMKATTAALVGGGAIAVTANAWQLLIPLAGLGALPWIVTFLRKEWRHPRMWGVWGVFALVALYGVLSSPAGIGSTKSVSPSLLFHPEWWWVAALVLAVGTAIAAYRKGLRAWGLAAVGMILGVVVLTAFLMWVSGSTWDDFLYYPSKAMWTGLVVVIPLAAAGGTVLLLSFWRRASRASSTVRLAMRGIAVCVVALIMAMVVGRGQAFPPHLVGIAQGAASGPNWSLAIMESLGKFDIPAQSRSGALIMGVEPSANPIGIHLGSTGTTDYLGMEALSQAGFAEAMTSPVKRDLAVRDSQRLCQYLKDHPDSLRFTGPNPAAGPGWMLDAGCPEQVVEPERWISLQFAPEWLERSPWADPDTWVYPTVAEVEAEGGKNLRVDASLLD